MKKFIFLTLMLICVSASVSYGAVSDDIYVRKDVFEAEMKNINFKLDTILDILKSQQEEIKSIQQELTSQKQEINELKKSVAVLSERIEAVYTKLSERIDANFTTLSSKIDSNFAILSSRNDSLGERLNDFRNNVYLGLVLLGIFVAWPSVKDYFKWREERRAAAKTLTAEEIEKMVERLITAQLANLK